MFYEIAGGVAAGILAAAGVVTGIVWVYDNWHLWGKKKPVVKPIINPPVTKTTNLYGLPYDPTSPLVKRFQFLAGITESYGGYIKGNYRFNVNKMLY